MVQYGVPNEVYNGTKFEFLWYDTACPMIFIMTQHLNFVVQYGVPK